VCPFFLRGRCAFPTVFLSPPPLLSPINFVRYLSIHPRPLPAPDCLLGEVQVASAYRGSLLMSMRVDFNQKFSRPGVPHKHSPAPKPVHERVLLKNMQR
jgi:hypothetical protein